MEGGPISIHGASAAEPRPSTRQRKLRKDTQSCWECKRNKARCAFSTTLRNVCDRCKRRGTDCVSQLLADRPPPPGSNRHIVDRLGQVEATIGQLLRQASGNGNPDVLLSDGMSGLSKDNTTKQTMLTPVSVPSLDSFHSPRAFETNIASDGDRSDRTSLVCAEASPNPTSTSLSPPHLRKAIDALNGQTTLTAREELYQTLAREWPAPDDLEAICSVPMETFSLLHGLACTETTPLSAFMLPAPKSLLQLPPPGSHPILVAQRLLILASFIQGMPRTETGHLRTTTKYEGIMRRAARATSDLVTCNDNLVNSLEGVQCIMLQAIFENYAGHLRQSWLTARRGLTVAQMLGLDRGARPPSVTGNITKAEPVWFRLVQLDRYLSLMLGLPQSSVEDSYATPEALQACVDDERLERIICVVAGRIMRRDIRETPHLAITAETDVLLQDGAALMPPSWWVKPTLPPSPECREVIRQTVRFNAQLMYYHALELLHLPYLFTSQSERQCEYNKATAVMASREVLSRVLSFSAFHSFTSYCRGVDFLVFVASTVMCLAHIRSSCSRGRDEAEFRVLQHQRLPDRGLLEQISTFMQGIEHVGESTTAIRVTRLLGSLLPIEEEAWGGNNYRMSLSPGQADDGELGCRVHKSDGGAALNIQLPHFRLITLERVISESEAAQTVGGSNDQCTMNAQHKQAELDTHYFNNDDFMMPGVGLAATQQAGFDGDIDLLNNVFLNEAA